VVAAAHENAAGKGKAMRPDQGGAPPAGPCRGRAPQTSRGNGPVRERTPSGKLPFRKRNLAIMEAEPLPSQEPAVHATRPVQGAAPRSAAAPVVFAHRGSAARCPENSRAAFRAALALGASGIELDVHLTRDGEPVVIHDATLDRTTVGHGPVEACDWAELRTVALQRADGEMVPHLDEILALLAPSGTQVIVEAKARADGSRYPRLASAVVEGVARAGMLQRCRVTAFDWGALPAFRALAPELRLAGVATARRIAQEPPPARLLRELRALGAAGLGAEWSAISAELAREVRDAGLELGAWTVNDVAAMRRVASLGATWIISDRLDIAREAFPDLPPAAAMPATDTTSGSEHRPS
jgi:glycerophosphoryl diester phosphodiesterase